MSMNGGKKTENTWLLGGDGCSTAILYDSNSPSEFEVLG